ncbi:CheY-like chemotaxis protein [Bradyrhizobium sp. GM0.4]
MPLLFDPRFGACVETSRRMQHVRLIMPWRKERRTKTSQPNNLPGCALTSDKLGMTACRSFVMLLVEDDSLQREVLSDLLKDEGFEVVECATAEAAELIVASTGTELRALITDHNLAGRMTGLELAEYARSAHPGLNIVLMSGTVMAPLPPNTTFLRKPFAPAHLLAAV